MSKINICFSSDDKYAQYLGISIYSILKNKNKETDIHFHVLDGGIKNSDKKKLVQLVEEYSCRVSFIEVDEKLFEKCPIPQQAKHISLSTYYRFILPDVLNNLDKSLYLDCDIIVRKDLAELYETDIEEFYCAMVQDPMSDAGSQRLGLTHSYFNAGVMLMNLASWRQNNITNKLFEFVDKYPEKILWVDQDVINCVLGDKIKPLDLKWNLQDFGDGRITSYNVDDYTAAKESPYIIHYVGNHKPWKTYHGVPNGEIYFEYWRESPWKKTEQILFQKNKKLLTESNLWNALWYKKEYNKKNLTNSQALDEYLTKTYKECNPSFEFDGIKYLNIYRHVLTNPLVHFLSFGCSHYLYGFFENKYFPLEKEIIDYNNYKKGRVADKVVYTCICDDYDDLEEIKAHKYINKDWDYVCFTDNEKHIKSGAIGIWEVRPLVFDKLDPTRNNRYHKINPHLVLPGYKESIYIDSNVNILTPYLFDLITSSEKDLLLPNHALTRCLYKEYEWAIKNNIDDKKLLEAGRDYIIEKGFPENYGMSENNVIYRKHHEQAIKKLMDYWWFFLENYAKRDQLSMSYVMWKHNRKIEDYIFENTRIDYKNFCVFMHKDQRG